MGVRKRVFGKGANVVVQAYGEVLLQPGGQVYRWNQRFIGVTRAQTAAAAPSNKRPHWAHYGDPLKATMRSSKPDFRRTNGGGRIYAAVGSTAPYAYYVDQGTGSYYAKILPPWRHGGSSLYEHTWKVPKSGFDRAGFSTVEWEEVGEIAVRGQRGQQFFAEGLDRAFRIMRLQRRVASPAQLVSEALNAMPHGIADFKGNTPADGAFIEQLKEWRAWRDEAWRSGRVLGDGNAGGREHRRRLLRAGARRRAREARRQDSLERRRAKAAARKRLSRERMRARGKTEKRYDKVLPKKPVRISAEERAAAQREKAIQADRVRFIQGIYKRYGDASNGTSIGTPEFVDGAWTVTITLRNGESRPLVSSVKFK